MRVLPGLLSAAALVVAAASWARDAGTLTPKQLNVPRASAPAGAAQVLQPNVPPARSGVLAIQPAVPAPSRNSTANVPQAQAQVDLCERILLGQAPPIPGLDCTRPPLEGIAPEGGGLTPRGPGDALDRTIDAIGRDPAATSPDGGVPPIILLGPR